MSHFNVSLMVWAKSQDSVHEPQFFEEKRKESRSGSKQGPSADQPSTLPLGHTDSQCDRTGHTRRNTATRSDVKCHTYAVCCHTGGSRCSSRQPRPARQPTECPASRDTFRSWCSCTAGSLHASCTGAKSVITWMVPA